MYSYGFNSNTNSFYYQLNPVHNCRVDNSDNNIKINPFYNQSNYNYNYNSTFNIDQEMSNLIHKFAEKVGATDENDEDRQQQGHMSHGQQGSRGMDTRGMEDSTGKHLPRVMQGGNQGNMGGENMGSDQYDLGRTTNTRGGNMNLNDDDMDDDMDIQGYREGSGMTSNRGGSGMGGGRPNMGQGQHQQFKTQMGSEEQTNAAGRGFKHDWKTSESMTHGGNRQNRRDL